MSLGITRPLRSEHARHLAGFQIPAETLEAAGVQSVTDAEARNMLGLNGHRGADLGGILFPCFHPMTGDRVGARIRLDHPLPDGGKYISEPGCRYLFFAAFPKEWLTETSIPVVLVESEKAALALLALAKRVGRKLIIVALGGCWGWLRKAGDQALPNGGHTPVTGPSPSLDLVVWRDRTVIILFDSNASSNPKVRKARRLLAQELAGRGACVHIGQVPGGFGVNGPDDLVAISGDEAAVSVWDAAQKFDECAAAEAEQALSEIETHKKADPLPLIEAIAAVEDPERRALLISRLAALRVPGVNRKFVEQQVSQRRTTAEADLKRAAEACRRGRLMAVNVEGAALLNEVCVFIQRFVFLLEAEALVLALWVLHTHGVDAADCTPYLSITSAEKQSGKSRLLEVLETVVANPWYTGRVTAAVLYRKIDAEAPTLLLDESDAAFKSGEEYGEALRGILNTGHRRGGRATCCVGQGAGISYQNFSTFSPKVIAGIGKLPDTVADRSIPVRLKRKARGEKVERFRLRSVRTDAEQLRERLEAWGAQNVDRLRDARPELPEELSDRQQDGAEPLLAIAELAGGEWPEAARLALVSLCCGAQVADDSTGALLLSDIRRIFITQDTDRLASAGLASALAEIETSPWGEWIHGRPITLIGVARLLKPFEIRPHPVRDGTKVFRGYEKTDFEDAWGRYLGPDGSPAGSFTGHQSVTTLQAASDAASSDFRSGTSRKDVTAQKCEKPTKGAFCNAVTLSRPSTEAKTNGMEEEL